MLKKTNKNAERIRRHKSGTAQKAIEEAGGTVEVL